MRPIVERDIKARTVKCKADHEAPFNQMLSLDQIASIFGITRPRVQQIEVRARKKIMELKNELAEVVVQSSGVEAEE